MSKPSKEIDPKNFKYQVGEKIYFLAFVPALTVFRDEYVFTIEARELRSFKDTLLPYYFLSRGQDKFKNNIWASEDQLTADKNVFVKTASKFIEEQIQSYQTSIIYNQSYIESLREIIRTLKNL